MRKYTVQLHIPEQDLEVDVIALSMENARTIALRDVRPLEVNYVATYTDLDA
ncbi:hypothetical protein JF714_15725 [Mycobacterium avium]|uniref:hypothetical protein n=1 Tax=Mycobacterium avium TaxID=1764 RepID=UPI001CDA717B|nr:hypothetical protein [Mycobacterium avium]MCA2331892.1 hypothetical protein [Mycobacterium avium]